MILVHPFDVINNFYRIIVIGINLVNNGDPLFSNTHLVFYQKTVE